jgi:hypothetical protein
MTDRAEVVSLPGYRTADLQQAEYFWRLLDHQRDEICEQLEHQQMALARFEHVGDTAAVRRKRRIIKALRADIRTIDRLLENLRIRLS